MLFWLPSSQLDTLENKKGCLTKQCGWSWFLGLRVEPDPGSSYFKEGEEVGGIYH